MKNNEYSLIFKEKHENFSIKDTEIHVDTCPICGGENICFQNPNPINWFVAKIFCKDCGIKVERDVMLEDKESVCENIEKLKKEWENIYKVQTINLAKDDYKTTITVN